MVWWNFIKILKLPNLKESENKRGLKERKTVKEKLEGYTQIGVEHFILRFLDFPSVEGTQLFAEKLIPEFSS